MPIFLSKTNSFRRPGGFCWPIQEIGLPVWPGSARRRFNLKAFPLLKSLFQKDRRFPNNVSLSRLPPGGPFCELLGTTIGAQPQM